MTLMCTVVFIRIRYYCVEFTPSGNRYGYKTVYIRVSKVVVYHKKLATQFLAQQLLQTTYSPQQFEKIEVQQKLIFSFSSSCYPKNIGVKFTHLYTYTFNVLADHHDPPQLWTLYCCCWKKIFLICLLTIWCMKQNCALKTLYCLASNRLCIAELTLL